MLISLIFPICNCCKLKVDESVYYIFTHVYRSVAVEDTTTGAYTESMTSEQSATDNVVITTSVNSKPATTVTKTRKKLVVKTSPMVAVAVDSTSKPPMPSKVPPLKRQSDLDKQFLASSLKVLVVYVFM